MLPLQKEELNIWECEDERSYFFSWNKIDAFVVLTSQNLSVSWDNCIQDFLNVTLWKPIQ